MNLKKIDVKASYPLILVNMKNFNCPYASNVMNLAALLEKSNFNVERPKVLHEPASL